MRPISVIAAEEGWSATPHTAAAESWLSTALSPAYRSAAVATRCSIALGLNPSSTSCARVTTPRWAAATSDRPNSPNPPGGITRQTTGTAPDSLRNPPHRGPYRCEPAGHPASLSRENRPRAPKGAYAVRRPNSTPATTTDTAMMPALHPIAAQAAAPGA